MSINYLIKPQLQCIRFNHIKTILGYDMKNGMITVIKQIIVINDIQMIGIITDKVTERIKDRPWIIGIFLRKEITTTDNHITVSVIRMKGNIISTVVFINVTISPKDHNTFNTIMTIEMIRICKRRIQHNMLRERLVVQ